MQWESVTSAFPLVCSLKLFWFLSLQGRKSISKRFLGQVMSQDSSESFTSSLFGLLPARANLVQIKVKINAVLFFLEVMGSSSVAWLVLAPFQSSPKFFLFLFLPCDEFLDVSRGAHIMLSRCWLKKIFRLWKSIHNIFHSAFAVLNDLAHGQVVGDHWAAAEFSLVPQSLFCFQRCEKSSDFCSLYFFSSTFFCPALDPCWLLQKAYCLTLHVCMWKSFLYLFISFLIFLNHRKSHRNVPCLLV